MPTQSNMTLSELKLFLQNLKLPSKTKFSISIDDENLNINDLKRNQSIAAIQKLKGSGNGKLMDALLAERNIIQPVSN